MPRLLLPCLLAGAPLSLLAGRPLVTDDATVLKDKACQLEAWLDRSRRMTQSWLVPACNFGAGIEWQAGFARAHEAGRSAFSEAYFQAKTAFRSIDDSPWGVGLTVGVARKPQREVHRGWDDPFLIVPLSASPDEGKTIFHFSPGWSRERQGHRDLATWGAAAERTITPRFTILAEAYGVNAERPFLRAGGRFTLNEQFLLDLTVVTRPGGTRDERFISLGVFWESARFLP